MTPAERRLDSGGLNPDPVEILIGVRGDYPAPMTSSERAIAKAQWECITQTAWWRSRSTVERLPCGCPNMDDWEWLDPCPGHVWTHWHPNNVDALSEFRLCFYCGVMETQRIGKQ